MSGHDKHASCDHKVAWCRHCDVIYCQRCEMTWAKPCQQIHGLNYQPQWQWRTPYYGTVSQTASTGFSSQTACLHGGGATSSS